MLVIAPPRVSKQKSIILTRRPICLPIPRQRNKINKEKKFMTDNLISFSLLAYLFSLSGTESLNELLNQSPSLTPFLAYHAFINFNSLPYWYISHVVILWKFVISWPLGACGPQFKSLIRSSSSLKNSCQPRFSLPLIQANGGQTPQPHLLNMYESCHNRTTMSSDKLSIFLREALELYGHCVEMHLSQMHIWPFLSSLSQVPPELSPIWAF